MPRRERGEGTEEGAEAAALPEIGCPTCGEPAAVEEKAEAFVSLCPGGHKHELGLEGWRGRLAELKPKMAEPVQAVECPTCGAPATLKDGEGDTLETRCKAGHRHTLSAERRKLLNR